VKPSLQIVLNVALVKNVAELRGNGGTASLVLLPHEPRTYTALESNEQRIYEMLRWFDKYVKNAPPRAQTAVR
jgi:hypothetical protein